jgi:hypothetical protein
VVHSRRPRRQGGSFVSVLQTAHRLNAGSCQLLRSTGRLSVGFAERLIPDDAVSGDVGLGGEPNRPLCIRPRAIHGTSIARRGQPRSHATGDQAVLADPTDEVKYLQQPRGLVAIYAIPHFRPSRAGAMRLGSLGCGSAAGRTPWGRPERWAIAVIVSPCNSNPRPAAQKRGTSKS